MRQTILAMLKQLLKEHDIELKNEIDDDTVLLRTGLDSLGFAVLVIRLEIHLGYDPFVLMSEPVYPRTFGEFVDVYERYSDHGQPT